MVELLEQKHGQAQRVWLMDRGMDCMANLARLRTGRCILPKLRVGPGRCAGWDQHGPKHIVLNRMAQGRAIARRLQPIVRCSFPDAFDGKHFSGIEFPTAIFRDPRKPVLLSRLFELLPRQLLAVFGFGHVETCPMRNVLSVDDGAWREDRDPFARQRFAYLNHHVAWSSSSPKPILADTSNPSDCRVLVGDQR